MDFHPRPGICTRSIAPLPLSSSSSSSESSSWRADNELASVVPRSFSRQLVARRECELIGRRSISGILLVWTRDKSKHRDRSIDPRFRRVNVRFLMNSFCLFRRKEKSWRGKVWREGMFYPWLGGWLLRFLKDAFCLKKMRIIVVIFNWEKVWKNYNFILNERFEKNSNC